MAFGNDDVALEMMLQTFGWVHILLLSSFFEALSAIDMSEAALPSAQRIDSSMRHIVDWPLRPDYFYSDISILFPLPRSQSAGFLA
jgi:hypothetical protein